MTCLVVFNLFHCFSDGSHPPLDKLQHQTNRPPLGITLASDLLRLRVPWPSRGDVRVPLFFLLEDRGREHNGGGVSTHFHAHSNLKQLRENYLLSIDGGATDAKIRRIFPLRFITLPYFPGNGELSGKRQLNCLLTFLKFRKLGGSWRSKPARSKGSTLARMQQASVSTDPAQNIRMRVCVSSHSTSIFS